MTDNNVRQENTVPLDLTEAQAQYQEYYAVREPLDINVVPFLAQDSTRALSPDQASPAQSLPTQEEFVAQVPEVFRLASELQVVDAIALAQLRNLGDAARIISDVLNQQNRKLNALLGYLLRSEDKPEQHKLAYEYGGAGVGFASESAYPLGQLIELKLFLTAESAAIYSIAEIIQCEKTTGSTADSPMYRVTVLFRRITDEDRELMIKASLHAQTRLLKKHAKGRTDSP